MIIVQGAPEGKNKKKKSKEKIKRKEKAAIKKYMQPGKRLWKI